MSWPKNTPNPFTVTVSSPQKMRATRRYQFVRVSDEAELVREQTEWVFVDAMSGRPRSVPPEVVSLFRVTGES